MDDKTRKERAVAAQKKYFAKKMAEDPEGTRAANAEKARKWREKNKERHQETVKAWREKNAARIKAVRLDYVERNKERRKEFFALYQKKHRDILNARSTAWRHEHKETVKKYRERIRDEVTRTYVAQFLKIPVRQITDELLELKRQQLFMRRMARELIKATRNESSTDTSRISGQPGRGDDSGRPAPDSGQQPVGAGSQGDQLGRRGGDGQGPGLDQQQPERRDQGGQDRH
jgi:hypothetical protein